MYGKFYLVYFTFLGVTPACVWCCDASTFTEHENHQTSNLNMKCVVCVCVCVFIKLHITAQPGLVILVIICHSR